MTRKTIALLIIMLVVFALPIIVLILTAISGVWRYPALLPETFSTRAIRYVWDQRALVGSSALNSILYALSTVAITLIISILPASLLARRSFRGMEVVETILLAPALVPAITFAVGIHVLFLAMRLVDTFFGVVLVLSVFSYPYMLRALIAGFEVYGEEYGVCARNLGASKARTMLRVEGPLLVPSIVAGGTIVFLVAFSEYFLVLLIGGGAVSSLSGRMFPFLNSADPQIASTYALIFLAIPLLLFFLVDGIVRRRYRRMGFFTEGGDS
jgi:putative spermidine/putrescine transport system permease protein